MSNPEISLLDKMFEDTAKISRNEDDFVVVSFCGEPIVKLHLSTLEHMGLLDLFFMFKVEGDVEKIVEGDVEKIKEALRQLESEMKSGKKKVGEPI